MTLIRVNGVRLYHEVHGSGVPILCIHGTAGSAESVRSVVEPLSALGRVIVYDRRGCLRSERPQPYATNVAEQAEDAAAIIDAVGGEPAVVLGHSYGAAIGLALAIAKPGLVRALVLLEPPVPGVDRTFDDMRRRMLGELETVTGRDPDEVAEWFLRGALGAGTWESLAPEMRNDLRGGSPAVIAEARGAGLEATPQEFASLRMPVLIVAGRDSPAGFRRVARHVAGLMPTARLVEAPGGHAIRPALPDVVTFVRWVLEPVAAPAPAP